MYGNEDKPNMDSLIVSFNEADRDFLNISEVVNDHSDYTNKTDEIIDSHLDDPIRLTIEVRLSESVDLFYLRNTVEVLS